MTSLSFTLYSGEPPQEPNKHLVTETRTNRLFEEVLMDNDTVGGYDIPVDPMDLLQCDSCQ